MPAGRVVFTCPVRGGWSRRAMLGALGGAGAAGLLAGCSLNREPDPPPPDPLEPLLESIRTLAAGYAAVLDTHPDLADRLQPLYEAHLAHEAAVLELIGRPDLPSPEPDAGRWAPPVDPGATAEEALAGLAEAERAGWVEARQACLAAPEHRVGTLGSIAAARATHPEVLQ